MANKRELMDELKEKMENEGREMPETNPFKLISSWWSENMYFHYGKDGERLDTMETIKDIALGPTIEVKTDEVTGNVQIVTTDPLHGSGQDKNEEVVVEADPEEVKKWLFFGVIAFVIGVIIAK